ncbi:phosphatase PAP2 family protein [Roseibium hamelinense]|uniref:phosphatase PAP2 family protein n=1 Tax=Roseibium hamelinense TaxID=150831 RepID=UPI001AD8EB9F|nr:phosphatase PAP2 family protein [Roseibium hamelinense]
MVFPRVDIWASGLFYSDDAGFSAGNIPILREFRHLGPYLIQVTAIVCVLVLLLKLLVPGRAPLLPLRIPVFLVSTLIIGPGILVNAILKDNWGRPRPRSVEEFGGDLPFQYVWVPSNACDSNCSFVSGEASAAMWLVALAFVAPRAWRSAILCFVLPLGFLLSLNRIAFGGHFLSDTLISWGLTLLVLLLTYRFLYVAGPRFVHDRHLDVWFTRCGRQLATGAALCMKKARLWGAHLKHIFTKTA